MRPYRALVLLMIVSFATVLLLFLVTAFSGETVEVVHHKPRKYNKVFSQWERSEAIQRQVVVSESGDIASRSKVGWMGGD